MIVRWPEALRPEAAIPGSVDERLVSFVDFAPTFLAWAGVAVPEALPGRSFTDPAISPREFVFASRDRIDETDDRQRAARDARWKYIRSERPEVAGGHALAFRDQIEMVRELHTLHEAG